MSVLSANEWAALRLALDEVRSGTVRPLGDERQTIEGVIWRLCNGARWRSMPAEFTPWWRAAQLHIRWSRKGVWEHLFWLLRDRGCPVLAEAFLDGTCVRAYQKTAGAKRGATRHALGRSRGGFGTKRASSAMPRDVRSTLSCYRVRRPCSRPRPACWLG